MTNRKLHMCFWLEPRMMTLDDLEVQIFSKFCATLHFWQTTAAMQMKIGPHCQQRNCCTLKVQIMWILLDVPPLGVYNKNTVVDGVTVKNASEGWFSELCPVYQGCCTLTFALATVGFLVSVDTVMIMGLVDVQAVANKSNPMPCFCYYMYLKNE